MPVSCDTGALDNVEIARPKLELTERPGSRRMAEKAGAVVIGVNP